MPHLFELHVSERYPAREWRHLGTFEARKERNVQTYTSKREDVMFAKYLKVLVCFSAKAYPEGAHEARVLPIQMLSRTAKYQ